MSESEKCESTYYQTTCCCDAFLAMCEKTGPHTHHMAIIPEDYRLEGKEVASIHWEDEPK